MWSGDRSVLDRMAGSICGTPDRNIFLKIFLNMKLFGYMNCLIYRSVENTVLQTYRPKSDIRGGMKGDSDFIGGHPQTAD